MHGGAEFRILGPVEVSVGGSTVPVGRRRERCLLGLLLLEPDHAIPIDRLVTLLWEEPPGRAHRAVHSHVARLRGFLATLPSPAPRLVTVGSGYALRVDLESIDAHRFRGMVSEARRCGTAQARAELLRAALDLWRGPVLDGTAPPLLRDRVGRDLDELRLTASDDWLAAELELGHHHDRLAELAAMVAEHPGRERLLGLYMLALHRSGRTSEALRAYEVRRRWLAEHEGLDPGPELRELHTTILRGERVAQPEPPSDVAIGPAHLPPETVSFVGRRAQLDQLDKLAADEGGTLPLVVITGMGGVGKTALALRWAHRVAAEFTGGQLYFDLRGYDLTAPAAPLQVLGAFLRALGVAPARIPGSLDEAAALYRNLTAGRRLLVLLDNAGTADQVRPLLPGGPAALVLVTSRDRMLGLAARDGARLVQLDALPSDEALQLLQEMIGAERMGREPIAAAAVAAECGHLPLALRIAGAELLGRAGQQIASYLTELRDGGRLSQLTNDGDARSAVRSVIERSYRRLDPAAARLFRLLAVVPGTDFDRTTVASVAALSDTGATALLTELTGAHMLHPIGADRYGFHDLVRDYARELADQDLAEQVTAVRRLYGYFQDRVDAAAHRIDPNPVRLPGAVNHLGASFPDSGSARAWVDRELANIVAVIAHAADRGPDPTAWRIADALRRYLWQRGNAIDALAVAVPAVRAADQAGDLHAMAAMELSMGQAEEQAGQYEAAIQRTRRALEISRQSGWVRGEAAALSTLGDIEIELGRLPAATSFFDQALGLFQGIDDLRGEADCRNGLGGVTLQLGQPEEATAHYRRALALYERIGSTGAAAVALTNLGEVSLDLGQLAAAGEYHLTALKLYRQVGRADGIAFALVRLATVHVELGSYSQALGFAVEGLDVIDRTDLSYRRVPALVALGAVARCTGDLPLALRYHHDAVRLARELGVQYLAADALIGLGATCWAAGRLPSARDAAAEAVALADAGGYRLLACQSRTLLATVLADSGAADQDARRHAEQALEMARAGGFRLAEALALEALARVSAPAPAAALLAEALATLTELGSTAADRVQAALHATSHS